MSIYRDVVIRIWGHSPEFEMSDAPRTHQSVNDAVEWLFAPILAEKERIAKCWEKECDERTAIGKMAFDRAIAAEAALAGERERCAKIAEAHNGLPCRSLLEGQRAEDYDCGQIDAATSIAAAIRAEGE